MRVVDKDARPLGLVSEPCRGRRRCRTAWFQTEGLGLDLKCHGILVSLLCRAPSLPRLVDAHGPLLGFSTDSGGPALAPAGLPSLLLSASPGPPVSVSEAPASWPLPVTEWVLHMSGQHCARLGQGGSLGRPSLCPHGGDGAGEMTSCPHFADGVVQALTGHPLCPQAMLLGALQAALV